MHRKRSEFPQKVQQAKPTHKHKKYFWGRFYHPLIFAEITLRRGKRRRKNQQANALWHDRVHYRQITRRSTQKNNNTKITSAREALHRHCVKLWAEKTNILKLKIGLPVAAAAALYVRFCVNRSSFFSRLIIIVETRSDNFFPRSLKCAHL